MKRGKNFFLKASSFQIRERTLCAILMVGFLLVLLPMLLIAQYNVPCGDDFWYGLLTHQAWEREGSLLAVLSAAGEQVLSSYQVWQGTFSAIFLMALQPAIFGEQYYAIGPFIMLAMFISGTVFFCWAFFRKLFGASRPQFLIVSIVWMGVGTQMLPSALEAFYWFNGAVFYTFFYAMGLFFYGLLILYLKASAPRRQGVFLALLSVIAVLIGGSNFVTSLLTLLILFCLLVYLLAAKNQKWKMLLIPFGLLLAAFLINVVAPGNAIRQSYFPSHPGMLRAVWVAVGFAFDFANKWLSIPLLLLAVALIPLFIRICRRTRFSFRYPLLVALVSGGLYVAQFCPHAYAAGSAGPFRLLNIIFFSFIFLLLANCFYVVGWMVKKLDAKDAADDTGRDGYSLPALLGFSLVLLLSCNAISFPTPYTSTSALQSIQNGEAQQYYREAQARFALLHDESIREAYLTPYSVWPYVLCADDDPTDPTAKRNLDNAAYYNKDLVATKEVS